MQKNIFYIKYATILTHNVPHFQLVPFFSRQF